MRQAWNTTVLPAKPCGLAQLWVSSIVQRARVRACVRGTTSPTARIRRHAEGTPIRPCPAKISKKAPDTTPPEPPLAQLARSRYMKVHLDRWMASWARLGIKWAPHCAPRKL